MSTTGARRILKRGDRIAVASHNPGKIVEINDLIRPHGVVAVSAVELELPEPEETGTTFAQNAALKALAAATASGLPALSDDSGLEVDALDGAPGVVSARWAGPSKNFAHAMARVERELQAKGAKTPAARRANFMCALCLAWPDGQTQMFEGRVFGTLVWPPRGANGFGYDAMFMPDGLNETFGELDPTAKHAISHRARAFALFVKDCFGDG